MQWQKIGEQLKTTKKSSEDLRIYICCLTLVWPGLLRSQGHTVNGKIPIWVHTPSSWEGGSSSGGGGSVRILRQTRMKSCGASEEMWWTLAIDNNLSLTAWLASLKIGKVFSQTRLQSNEKLPSLPLLYLLLSPLLGKITYSALYKVHMAMDRKNIYSVDWSSIESLAFFFDD